MNKKTMAVIFGGQSSEHEVSRVSAESVIRNIDKDKFHVAMIGITKDGRWLKYDGPEDKIGSGEWQALAEEAAKAAKDGNVALAGSPDGDIASPKDFITRWGIGDGGAVDVIFPVLHGTNGEDGTIQGMFEMAGIPYVGCGVLGSALGMDKAYSKIVFEKESIPQGKYLTFSRKGILKDVASLVGQVEGILSYPCFVKPSNAGSSVGVSKARNREELIAALEHAQRYDRRILVEEFIDGREVECAVLGNEEPMASVVGEVIPCNDFYDYQAKYQSGDSSTVLIPASLPEDTANKIREYATRAFKALDCSGLSRVDFFVHRITGEIYINEINTLPGFTSISMYPKLWEATGIPYAELIERLVGLAMERFEDSRREI